MEAFTTTAFTTHRKASIRWPVLSGSVSVQVVLILLAIVGVAAIASILSRSVGSTARVLRAAHGFQATSVEAIMAIRQTPPDEARQFRAIKAWEEARAFMRTLEAGEQLLVVQTLKDREFPTSDVGDAIRAFMEAKDMENRALDDQLAELMAGAHNL